MVTVYQLDGTESEPIAEYHDGEWTSGADAMEPVFGEEPPTQEELLESLDGPRLFASMPEDAEDEKGIDEADHRDPGEVLRDPDEPTTNSLAIKEDRRVYVSNMMEVPDGAVAHHDDEEGLYYEREPEPEDETEKAAGSLVKFLDSLLGR